jgi:hypothetical protein
MAILDGYQAPVVATWNSSTVLNTALTVPTAGFDTCVVTHIPSGTITAGVITFEVFDGATWLPVKCAQVNSYATNSTYMASSGSNAWQVPVSGFPQFRVRLSTQLAGTSPVALITIVTSSAPDTSVCTVGLDPNAITNTVAGASVSAQAALTVANVKTSQGNVYGVSVANPNASTIFLQFYNTAGTPTLGTGVVWFLAIPASTTLNIPPGLVPLANLATGIGIGAATTATGGTAPGTAPSVTIFYA